MERVKYASDPGASRGRKFATDQSPTRSEFQRDRDRILHSTAFRRLQYKTQVFLHHEGRHFRTRLTHTIEVAQIARSISRALGLNEDLAEAVALAHDLGHPPFGHAGERTLDKKMSDAGGFDHNIQALRVISLLENRYAGHDGLNLSWETVEGILKHNGPVSDEELGAGVLDLPLPPDLMPETHASLEAQCAAIADDIAYNSHDVDDAIRAGLLTLDDFDGVPLVGPIVSEVLSRWPDIEPHRQTHEVQRRLITRFVEGVISHSEALIGEAGPESADDVRQCGKQLVGFDPELQNGAKGLKSFMFDRVYRSELVMIPVREGQAIVGDLFDHYFRTGGIPGGWGKQFESLEAPHSRARLVCDFISGMTDPFAKEAHRALFDAKR